MSYSSGTFDCFSDPSSCLLVWCCAPCAIGMDLAKKIDAEDTHGCGKVCKSICATMFWPCGLCCCAESIQPCFLTELLKKSMKKHNITTPPGPCGDKECCGCYFQMCLPCTASCTLCLMIREANAHK